MSSDLKMIFYSVNLLRPSPQRAAIAYSRDLQTGQTRELMRSRDAIELFPAPVPSTVALFGTGETEEQTMKLFGFKDGQTQEQWTANVPKKLVRHSPKSTAAGAAWTPDGRYLLYVRESPDRAQLETELWLISAQTGAIRQTELSVPDWVNGTMAVHPDGKQVFYTASEPSVSEIWVMENFLPPVTAAK